MRACARALGASACGHVFAFSSKILQHTAALFQFGAFVVSCVIAFCSNTYCNSNTLVLQGHTNKQQSSIVQLGVSVVSSVAVFAVVL